MKIEFTGKTVLITGATQNLGFTLARRFATDGAKIVVHGPTNESAAAACEQLEQKAPGQSFHPCSADLADRSAVDGMFASLQREGHRIDILVNNAAQMMGYDAKPFLDADWDLFERIMAVNFIGAARCCYHAGNRMRADGGGTIINISSLAAERILRNRVPYNTSKAALESLTRSLAVDLASVGIRVNTVTLGYLWTERWNKLPPEKVTRRRKNIPRGDPATQEEVADLVLFLASPCAAAITGARYIIDGGINAIYLPPDAEV